MAMSDHDRKKLWGRSGNVCSYPRCGAELTRDGSNRVIGEEAHVKGEKPGAARYDPNQPPDEREGYENRILLCPTHHVEIDSDEAIWTVDELHKIKLGHEQDVEENRRHPELLADLRKLMRQYEGPARDSVDAIQRVIEGAVSATIVRVDASREEGVDTGIRVRAGQRIVLYARGLITYDGGHGFASPEGVICDALGIPIVIAGVTGPVIWPHPAAYQTDGGAVGTIGSLIGWIGSDRDQAFRVGARWTILAPSGGHLHLAVNDARGTYADNDGEYRVDIRIDPV